MNPPERSDFDGSLDDFANAQAFSLGSIQKLQWNPLRPPAESSVLLVRAPWENLENLTKVGFELISSKKHIFVYFFIRRNYLSR